MRVTEFFAGKVTWYVVYDGKCMGREKPRRRVCEQRMTEKKTLSNGNKDATKTKRGRLLLGNDRGCEERFITANTEAMN